MYMLYIYIYYVNVGISNTLCIPVRALVVVYMVEPLKGMAQYVHRHQFVCCCGVENP